MRRSIVAGGGRDLFQDAFDAHEPRVAVALVPYSGDVAYAAYTGGLVGGPEGWRTWGTLRPGSLPAIVAEAPADEAMLMTDPHTDLDAAAFSAGVLEVREAVLRGEVYVLNLTRRLTSCAVPDPATCFRSFGEHAPSSMSAAWAYQDRWIASASPERLPETPRPRSVR